MHVLPTLAPTFQVLHKTKQHCYTKHVCIVDPPRDLSKGLKTFRRDSPYPLQSEPATEILPGCQDLCAILLVNVKP